MISKKKESNGSIRGRISKLGYSLASFDGIVMVFAFIVVFVFFSIAADNFLTAFALSNVVTFGSIYGIIVVGVCFLMISGEFDLSVGSNFVLTAFIFAQLLIAGVHPVLAMSLCLMAAALLGLINGLIVVWSGIPSFIVTLGTLLAYRGIARALGSAGGGMSSFIPDEKPLLFSILNGNLQPFNQLFNPAANFHVSTFWFVLIIIIMSIILSRTPYGSWVFATGGNLEAAAAQGVNVKRVKITNFVISGLLAGVAAVAFFANRSSVNELVGSGVELQAVAACVIGGTRLRGGKGSIIGAALGILLISMLEQGLVLMGVSNQIFWGIVGLIIIISMILNNFLENKTATIVTK